MYWYRFNFTDYQVETYGIPDAEDLAYRRLMDRYYAAEGPLPNDESLLCNQIGLDWDCIEPVLTKFFMLNEVGEWVHPVWQVDIKRRKDRAARRSKTGSAAGRPVRDRE